MPSFKRPCRYCNQLNPADSNACPFCGRVNPVGPLRCPKCENPIQKDSKACSSCGLKLETTCPSCGKTTFLGDYCEFCNAQLVVICGNPKCKTEQRIGREKCIKCGKPLKCDEAGFKFTFNCDICGDGYKTSFIESKSRKKAGFLRGLGTAASIGSSFLGSAAGYGVERGANAYAEKFQGMSPAWHKEHEAAFETAQNEAKGHFQRCPKCRKYVCDLDWNEQEGLCVEDAPRQNVEVAAAKASKMVRDIQNKADNTEVFAGTIESKQTICPKCGKPAGEGKFCNNCGTSLSLLKCAKCGTQSPAGTSFCGGCGSRLGQ